MTTFNATTKVASPTPTIINTKYRCGKNFGGKTCAHGKCCSKQDYCGTSNGPCREGCIFSYGRYNDGGRCGSEFGKCLNDEQCCSKHGYCSISKDHCEIG